MPARKPLVRPTARILRPSMDLGMPTLAAVAMGGNFVDMLTGRAGTITGTPASVIDQKMGPSVKFSGGTDNIAIAGKRSFAGLSAPINTTLAVITTLNSVAASLGLLAVGTNGTDTNYTYIGETTNNTNVSIGNQGLSTGALGSSTFINTGEPFFMIASQNVNGTTQTFNILVLKLNTGQVLTGTGTNSGYGSGSRNGTFNIGSRGGGSLNANATIAAAFAVDSFISLAQMQKIALDPWSLWYV